MSNPKNNPPLFIVGIGASAGGLESLEAFFKAMPTNSGLAFIIVVHLDPNHVSLLPELLQRRTSMTVTQITDNQLIEANKIYVIPPNKRLSLVNKHFQILDLEVPRASHLPIDYFFRSLAQDQGDKAIAIVLSGTGSDGSQGLKEIKAEAGLVIAQDEATAKYAGMPNSAIATGFVDYVLSPADMPAKLIQYCQFPYLEMSVLNKQASAEAILQKILLLIRNRVGHDFSQYKKNTIYRRIERRMQLHQIEKLADYFMFAQKNEQEVSALAKELLIGVTSFFRDPEAFELLKTKYLTELLAQKPDDYAFRVWIPGCSTGEEAYSIAILLQECQDILNKHFHVQIFGTDIDESAIEIARRGYYSVNNISTTVSDERLLRFFIKEAAGFRIKKSIREMLVFASQNITKDPPFTKLDLISCRNLLIYFSSELQRKILPLFHYGLKESGILFLGSSETTGQSNEFFNILDRKWKIFNRSSLQASLPKTIALTMQDPYETSSKETLLSAGSVQNAEEISLLQMVEAILRRSAVAPCAIIDAKHNMLYVHGKLGRYLEPAEGKITLNIVDMIHPGLKADLIFALRKASQQQTVQPKKPSTYQSEHGPLTVAIKVAPILEHSTMQGLMMVVFEETPSPPPTAVKNSVALTLPTSTKTIEELQQELILTKENLQTTIEELETANEELKSANEELQSTNEELQSTNEELETSKEELQSLNEEAVTVNAELQNRIDDYQTANDDLKNLFDSTHMATIFLDTKLCVRRFTPKAIEIISLVATDIGRPISHFSCSLAKVNLSEIAKQVLKTLDKHESEQQDDQGRCFLTRIQPYRTANNVIDGVVLSFEDISARKQTELALIDSEQRYKSLFDFSPIAIWEEDCSIIAQALQQLRAKGIKDLGDYLAKNSKEGLQLYSLKRILAANHAALILFNALNKDEIASKLSQLLSHDAIKLCDKHLLALWKQEEKFSCECQYADRTGLILTLNITWTIPNAQGNLNYGNIISTAFYQNAGGPL